MLPPFETLRRLRPVDLLAPGSTVVDAAGEVEAPAGAVAPYLAVVADDPGPDTRVGWTGPGLALTATLTDDRVGLTVTLPAGTTTHASRRHRRTPGADGLAATLTGDQLTAWTREAGRWVARARVDLPPAAGVRREETLAALRVTTTGAGRVRAGRFGQLGLRDLHWATTSAGDPVRYDGGLVLTATHAGPGFFATGHTGVWTFDPATQDLTHRADLFFRRPPTAGGAPGIYGDHATHLVRDGDAWLVATSTWGDFDHADVRITLARTSADLLDGAHVLDAEPLAVPLDAAGVWDPHLLRLDGAWWLGLTAARRFFDFRPALFRGPRLDALELVGTDESRRATEGTVLARLPDGWRLLASDGRDNARGQREAYGVYDLALRRVGELDAPYPSNIPWPNVVPDGDDWWLVTFDGTAYPAGDADRRGVLTSGSHGDVLVMRSGSRQSTTPASRARSSWTSDSRNRR